jgi:hypothetical protein
MWNHNLNIRFTCERMLFKGGKAVKSENENLKQTPVE